MKQISGLSSMFNRRRSGVNKSNATPSPSRRQRGTQQQQDNNPYMSRINIIHTSSNDNNGGHTVSTLTNQDHLFQTRQVGMDSKVSKQDIITNKSSPMIRAERKNLMDVDDTDTSNATFQHGVDYHLSPREKLWYKNQMYLLEKEKKAASPNRHRGSPTTPVSSQYALSNNRNDQYSLSYGEDYKKHSRYSPSGVDEFGQTESNNNVYNRQQTIRHRGSPPSINAPHRRGKMTNQSNESSTLFSEGDTYDDTNQSSTLFGDEETYDDNTYEEDTFAGDTLEGDTTIGSVTYTTMEGEESLLTESILRPNTYKYELVDDRGSKQRRYKVGVGQSPSSRRRSLAQQQVASPSPSPRKSTNKRVTIHAPRGRRDDDSIDEVGCPFSEVLEEVQGTMQDAKKTCQQVIYAFVISEDAIDRMSDKLRDAKLELVELYHEQRAAFEDRRAVSNGQRKFPEYSKRYNGRRDAFR